MVLAHAQFSYNNSMNRSTGKTPFEIVSGMTPKGVFYLKDVVVDEEKRSAEAEVFSKHRSSIHKEVKLKLEQSNHNYKENIDKRRRHHDFEGRDKVMVHLKKGRFLVGHIVR